MNSPSNQTARVSLPDEPVPVKSYLTFCDDIHWCHMHHEYHAGDIPDLVHYWHDYQTVHAQFVQAVSEVSIKIF